MMINNPFCISGKNIIITGASSGIGKACAIECAKQGATVALLGRNEKRLNETLGELKTHGEPGRKHLAYTLDLIDENVAIQEVINDIVETNGKLNGFIHSAGIEKTIPAELMKPSDYLELFKVNFLSGFEIARNITKRKYMDSGASLIFISSITSLIGRKGIVGYSATKGAIVSGIRSLALELAVKKIRVNAVSPGTILTPMVRNYLDTLSEEDRQKRIDGYPLGLGNPEDVAYLCIYLLSDASRWITGQNYILDGGYTIK